MSLRWNLIPGWLLAIIVVVGNGLVIFLIATRRNLRTTTNWFVLSLAVADFGVGAVYYPRWAVCPEVIVGCANEAPNIASLSIGVLCVYASGTNLCVLTLDRYLAIVHPLRCVTFMTKKRVALLIFLSWVEALTISLVSSLRAILSGTAEEVMWQLFLLCSIALGFFGCMFLLFATVRIFFVVRRIAKQNAVLAAQLNVNHELEHGVAFKVRETATAKMVGIVVTVCVVSYLLHIAGFVLLIAEPRFSKPMFQIATIIMLLNSAANPVAYAFYKKEFKRELKTLFRCSRQQVLQNNSGARGEHRGTGELRAFKNRAQQASIIEL